MMSHRRTTRLIGIVIGVLVLVYLANLGFGYYQASRMDLPPLKPSAFTVLGFPAEEMEQRRWRIRITHEVPKVVEQLREVSFSRPDYYPETGEGDNPQDAKRVDPEEVARVCPVVLTEAHIEKAWVEEREAETLRARPGFSVVHLKLTPEGRARLWRYARERVARFRALGEKPRDERLLIKIGDQFWAAPIIRSEVASSWWLVSRLSALQRSDVQIQPIFDPSIAETIVKGLEEAKTRRIAHHTEETR
ncbi:MAG: hypothetical protein N2045_00165 [Fimbriimonadales bacterium]|jgi:hypothetical protein|nr:hypothetical protein [Armatimonadota bacterium]MCX7686374.1 hypothetical protein [Fimbriimonadales bacterium]CUU10987.1 hypothetical protein GBSOP10_108819 [Armatimonadetes bacterium GBS]CUU33803.1 hypothetical protein GXSOP10_10841 [Armatimonadetes bacterium GXS]CUU35293.1 hypothetical protein DCOP10_114135 [Armatimonadetes bacterium DC]GBC89414.1 hypothetical protein HRbin14_00136 [bacterium HR14]